MQYEGKDADENIIFVIRRSSITNFPWILTAFVLAFVPFFADPLLHSLQSNGDPLLSGPFLGALTMFWFLFTFGYFLTNFLNWYFNILIVTNKKIIDMDFNGLTYKNISQTTLDNVEDVTSNITGPFGTIFNIGTLLIQTAGEQHEFEFTDMADPTTISDAIGDLVANRKRNGNN